MLNDETTKVHSDWAVVLGPELGDLGGGPRDDLLIGTTKDFLIDGGLGVDTAQVLGTDGDNDLAVGRNLALDDPALYVFGDGLYGAERVQIEGVERLEVFGGGGDDTLVVSDLVYGTDMIFGRFISGSVTVKGVDLVTFYGGRGDDTLDAAGTDGSPADGRVVAYGGVGQDTLLGSSFADRLFGGSGDDVLQGGGGTDRFRGGAGDDAFVYLDVADAPTVGGRAGEQVADFSPGQDVIDLSAIDAVPGGSDDAFRFLGSGSPDVQLLQSGDLYYDPEEQALKGFVGEESLIAYEPNFTIALPGVAALSEGDLIL
jgi:Ca2+-binding RTX toxin-like protein